MCQLKIYPDLENSFLNLIHNSGHPDIKLEKKLILTNFIMKDLIKKRIFTFFLKNSLCFFFSSSEGFITFLKYKIFFFQLVLIFHTHFESLKLVLFDQLN